VGSEHTGEEVLGDKGYHEAETLDLLTNALGMRPYVPEPKSHHQRVWTHKPQEWKAAVYGNRRRSRGRRGRKLGRLRSEYAERSFAHLCETGATRRLGLPGTEDVAKCYLMRVAARNLCVIMRALFSIGTPRGMQGMAGRLISALWPFILRILSLRFVIRATEGAEGAAAMHRYSPIPLAA
jgi:transposase